MHTLLPSCSILFFHTSIVALYYCFWKLFSQVLATFLSYFLASFLLLFFYTFLTTFCLLSLHTILPRSLLLLGILIWKVMNSNEATAIKLLSQLLVMPSPFLTSLFWIVSLYVIAVAVTTRVTVDHADVWKLQTLALIVYRYGIATVWITSVVGIHLVWAIQLPLTTKLPMFPRINWQVRHHQTPVNLLSQQLILPSAFLTTVSITLDWIQSAVATQWTH